ncbi:MAG: 50S ribosomal protein L35 [Deltaproteobacteria bacterium]|nr:50S ribosomal protein L35 [Deltaproteobacteria bacterium]
MPKIKNNRAAAKRFARTGKGKVRVRHAYASHILGKKSSKRKRNLRQSFILDKTNVKAVHKLLPYF